MTEPERAAHIHHWESGVSPVTGEPYDFCSCGKITTNVLAPPMLRRLADELTIIMMRHLHDLTEEEKQARIEAGRRVLEAIKGKSSDVEQMARDKP